MCSEAEQAELGGRGGDRVPGELQCGDFIVRPSPWMEEGGRHTEDEDDSPFKYLQFTGLECSLSLQTRGYFQEGLGEQTGASQQVIAYVG